MRRRATSFALLVVFLALLFPHGCVSSAAADASAGFNYGEDGDGIGMTGEAANAVGLEYDDDYDPAVGGASRDEIDRRDQMTRRAQDDPAPDQCWGGRRGGKRRPNSENVFPVVSAGGFCLSSLLRRDARSSRRSRRTRLCVHTGRCVPEFRSALSDGTLATAQEEYRYGEQEAMGTTQDYAQGMDASSYGSTGTVNEEERVPEAPTEPEWREAEAETEPAAVPEPESEVPVEAEANTPPPAAGSRLSGLDAAARDLLSAEGEADEASTASHADAPPSSETSAETVTSEEKEKLSEEEARRAALARRAAEEAEIKAAEAAEKARRDSGAPVEKEAPKTIFDYYKPKVLEPVYVGGYWKRANPWDKGRRHDDGQP